MVQAQVTDALVLARDALEALASVSIPLKLVQAVGNLAKALRLR